MAVAAGVALAVAVGVALAVAVGVGVAIEAAPVSYTHLTLPTN